MTLLGLMVAGAVGAVCRYVVDLLVTSRFGHAFPWGTLVINVSGSALLGFLTGLGLYHGFSSTSEVILGSGFCGGFTTFSTHMVDTVKLGEAGRRGAAFLYVLVTLGLATSAAALGLGLAAL